MSRLLDLRVAVVSLTLLLTSACVPSFGGDDEMTVTAFFPDTAGLFVGNDVGVLGVQIGTITDIEPEGTQVRVTMRVDAERNIPVDVGAVVVARSVATDRYVELTPVYSGGETMGDGDEIPVDRTRTPVDFDDVLEVLNTFATGIAGSKESTEAIKNLIDNGADALDGRGQLVNDTVGDLAGAVGDVTDKREDISATLRSLDTLVATIAANEDTARTFISQVAEAADLLDDERINFRRALRNLDRAVTTVAAFALEHRDDIVEVFGSSSKVMRTITSKQDQLAEILEVMPLALQNLSRAGAGSDRLPVRVPPTVLLPLGDQILQICDNLPFGLCDLIIGTDPSDRSSR